jgi:hypothetical protein
VVVGLWPRWRASRRARGDGRGTGPRCSRWRAWPGAPPRLGPSPRVAGILPVPPPSWAWRSRSTSPWDRRQRGPTPAGPRLGLAHHRRKSGTVRSSCGIASVRTSAARQCRRCQLSSPRGRGLRVAHERNGHSRAVATIGDASRSRAAGVIAFRGHARARDRASLVGPPPPRARAALLPRTRAHLTPSRWRSLPRRDPGDPGDGHGARQLHPTRRPAALPNRDHWRSPAAPTAAPPSPRRR